MEKILTSKGVSKKNTFFFTLIAKYILAILLIILLALVSCRVGQKKAEKAYNEKLEEFIKAYKSEQEAAAIAAIEAAPIDPVELEAEALAKVLYGVKDNSTDDLRTMCWCVINRADNPNYPDTIEEVVAQPSQWMRYDDTNPVLEDLYQIARAELETWHGGGHRPVSNEYVYMVWSASEISLKNEFNESSGTRYWRIK